LIVNEATAVNGRMPRLNGSVRLKFVPPWFNNHAFVGLRTMSPPNNTLNREADAALRNRRINMSHKAAAERFFNEPTEHGNNHDGTQALVISHRSAGEDLSGSNRFG